MTGELPLDNLRELDTRSMDEIVRYIVADGLRAVEELEGPAEGRTLHDLVRHVDPTTEQQRVIEGAKYIQSASNNAISLPEAVQRAKANESYIAAVVEHVKAVV